MWNNTHTCLNSLPNDMNDMSARVPEGPIFLPMDIIFCYCVLLFICVPVCLSLVPPLEGIWNMRLSRIMKCGRWKHRLCNSCINSPLFMCNIMYCICCIWCNLSVSCCRTVLQHDPWGEDRCRQQISLCGKCRPCLFYHIVKPVVYSIFQTFVLIRKACSVQHLPNFCSDTLLNTPR